MVENGDKKQQYHRRSVKLPRQSRLAALYALDRVTALGPRTASGNQIMSGCREI